MDFASLEPGRGGHVVIRWGARNSPEGDPEATPECPGSPPRARHSLALVLEHSMYVVRSLVGGGWLVVDGGGLWCGLRVGGGGWLGGGLRELEEECRRMLAVNRQGYKDAHTALGAPDFL